MGQIRVLFVTVGDFFPEGEKPVAIWKKLRYLLIVDQVEYLESF